MPREILALGYTFELACGLGPLSLVSSDTPSAFAWTVFIFQPRWGENVFVRSELMYGMVQVVFPCLTSVGKGFRQAGSIETFGAPVFETRIQGLPGCL